MLSLPPKKLCYHNDSFYKFSIRDTDGKLLLRINGGISGVKLKDFLKEMWKQAQKYPIAIERNFFYRNLEGKFVLIDSQFELQKLLELTKYHRSMPLYLTVDLNMKIAEIFVECEQCCGNKKKYNSSLSNKTNLKSRTKFGPEQTENVKTVKEYIDEKFPCKTVKEHIDEKFPCENWDEIYHQSFCEQLRIPSTQEKLCNNLHKKQKESKDIKVLSQLNDSSTVPPPWFKEYMETMKNDMVYKITHEVTKKVSKKMFKYLDHFLQNLPIEQSQPRYYTSFSGQNLQCFSEPIEKNQDQKKSQDEEQSSDASIEHMEEPQNADTAKDVQVTKNESSTVNSKKIIKNISEMLNSNTVPSKTYEESGNSVKKNHRLTEMEEQLKYDVTLSKFNEKVLEEVKRRTQKFIEEEVMLEEKKHQRDAQIATDNLENDAKSQEKLDENSANPKLRSIKSADWKPGKIENGFHMSCSVTGHQMLDENQQNIKDLLSGRCSDASDTLHIDVDNISFCTSNQEENDDDTFEIIQMPTSENDSFTHYEEPVAGQHDSSLDSPRFEITESSSPCFIYITEDHFAANEGKSKEEDPQSNNNNNSTSCGEYQSGFDESVKSMNTDLEKRSDGATYSFVTETTPAQDLNSFCKSLRVKQRSNEGKCSRNEDGRSLPEDTCGLYDDVRNSHTSYLTVQTHCDCLSQCANLGDLTQSFHSHTTSINDIIDVSHRLVSTDNSHSPQMPSTDAQDAAAISKSGIDLHVDNDREKNARMNEMHNADNPKCRASTPQDAFTDTLHQCHRANGFSDKSSPYAGSRKTFTTEQPSNADSVHILPETLVFAAAQVGSYAYDTAREVFDKIRAHAKEDSTKRRSGTKSDHKKPFGNLPFI